MPLTIETITYQPASDASSPSTSTASAKPTISLTLSGIGSRRKYKRPRNYLLALYQQYPRLFHLMPYADYKFQKNPERQLILDYQGKGPVRALIRGILAQSESISQTNSAIIISPTAREQTHKIREQLLRTPSPPAQKERTLYHPSTADSVSMSDSLGGVEKQTIGNKAYIMYTIWSAGRRISDIIAGLAELTAHLSAEQSPLSVGFNNSHGERMTVGSVFNPDAVTVEEHLSFLSEDGRRAFIEEHAAQWGECVAWNLYIGQGDAHLRNIMFDKRTGRLFILDFDQCYGLRTGKYNNLTADYFPLISQSDIRSPLKPVNRLFDNWFCKHQKYLTASENIHTLVKLGVLPGLDTACQSIAFNIGYYRSLYACTRLTYEHFHACFSKHVANPQLLHTMCEDFATRSVQLQQQLFSMPSFIHLYQQYPELFSQSLTHMGWGEQNPTLLDIMSFKLACQAAITAKCAELQHFDSVLFNGLLEKPDSEAAGLWKRRAELELTAIDELIVILPEIFDGDELTAKIEPLKRVKESIIATKVVMTIPDEEKIPLFKEIISQFSACPVPTSDEMESMRSAQFAEQVEIVSMRIKDFTENFKHYFKLMVLLEHYQHPFLFELSATLTAIGRPYVAFFNYVIERINKHRLMRVTFDGLNNNMKLQMEIGKMANYYSNLSKTIHRLSSTGLISLFDYLSMKKAITPKINHLHLVKIEVDCLKDNYPKNIIKCFNSVYEQLLSSILLHLQTPGARQLLLTYIKQITAAFTDLLSPYKLNAEKQRIVKLLDLYATSQNVTLFSGIVAQIQRLVDVIQEDLVTLPPYPASLALAAVDDTITTKVADLLYYNQDYSAAQAAASGYDHMLKQLYQIVTQLHTYQLISPESHRTLDTTIAALSRHYQSFVNQCEQRQASALTYLQAFKATYDKAATAWKYSFTPSLFASTAISRPTTLEQQHQIYARYMNKTLDAWTAWVGIHALGRQATQVTGLRSFMRQAEAQTYYASFSPEPDTLWSWTAASESQAAASSNIQQPSQPSILSFLS